MLNDEKKNNLKNLPNKKKNNQKNEGQIWLETNLKGDEIITKRIK
jgi:hypothetical protein